MFHYSDFKPGQHPYNHEKLRALTHFRDHQMTIEQDNGVFRSLLFKAPNTGCYHFRLVTWPGHLAISGDIGDYVFSRTYDMFKFFTYSDDPASSKIGINADYWEEKCQAKARHGGTEEFDEDRWKEYIVQTLRETDFSDYEPGTKAETMREAREELLDMGFRDEDEARNAATVFLVPGYKRKPHAEIDDLHPFEDAWECRFTRPCFRFLLCCYAISWGIKRYAQRKEGRDMDSQVQKILAGQL